MDEMIIRSGLTKGIIGAIIKKVLKKKFDISPDIAFTKFEIASTEGGDFTFKLNVEGRLSLDDICKLTKKFL